jgi:signal transduction histidine kinase
MSTKQERLVVLGRLSSVLAHEIRNPLAGISAATQLLAGKMGRDDPKSKYVGMILKEIGRVDDIVKNLLDFSREGRACMMRADLRAIVDAALAPFAAPFERVGIRVETHHGADVPFVVCDAEQMGRVFRNLIANAVDAMPQGGALTVRTALDGANDVTVSFEDTGKGTDVEDVGELFSPFYTTKTKGNGLGLPVALKCVEDHGGTITARRGAACGMTMTVRWPLGPHAPAGGPAGREQQAHPGR